MSGMINNFYYGKAGKADYTPDQLPANRVELFFEMLRIRFSGLVGMNLLAVLTSLPTIVWSFLSFQVVLLNLEQSAADAAMVGSVNSALMLYFLLLIPCLMISSVFSTGIIYVLRNWARDQHAFTLSDFKDAVKENWKGGLLLGFINGASLLLTYVAYTYYGQMAVTGGYFFYIPQMLVVILCCIWWMANMLITPMMVTYDMSFKTLVSNSIIMTLSRLPWSLLIWGVSIGLPFVIAYFVPYGIVFLALVYLVIGLSLTYFVYVSYANSCFDRFLNPRIEGAPVNMGLRDPNLAEEEVEVTEEDIKNL